MRRARPGVSQSLLASPAHDVRNCHSLVARAGCWKRQVCARWSVCASLTSPLAQVELHFVRACDTACSLGLRRSGGIHCRKKMMTTCCAIIGLVFLVLTNLAIIIAFATPYWIIVQSINRGLWAYCMDQTCTWVFQEENTPYLEGQKSAWWLATQALMCFGLGLALFALLVSTVALCCECKRCNSNHAVAGLLLLAFLVIGVAVVVFGISVKDELNVDLDSQKRYSWSFWLAAASSGLSLLSAIIYVCEGRAQY